MKKQVALTATLLLLSLLVFQQYDNNAIAAITAGNCNGSGGITNSDIVAARGHLYEKRW